MTELDPAAGVSGQSELEVGREMLLNDVSEFVNALTDPSGPRNPDLNNESLNRVISFGVFLQGAGEVALAYRAKLNEAQEDFSHNVTEHLGSVSLIATSDETIAIGENTSEIISGGDSITGEVDKVLADTDNQPNADSDKKEELEGSDSNPDEDKDMTSKESPQDVESTAEEDEEVLLTSEELFILKKMLETEHGAEVDKSHFEGFEDIEDRASKGAYQQAFSMAIKELTKLGLLSRPSRLSYALNRENPQFEELITKFLGQ